MTDLERPPAAPAEGTVPAFDAGWNAHGIGLDRETVRLVAADPGWAMLGWDMRATASGKAKAAPKAAQGEEWMREQLRMIRSSYAHRRAAEAQEYERDVIVTYGRLRGLVAEQSAMLETPDTPDKTDTPTPAYSVSFTELIGALSNAARRSRKRKTRNLYERIIRDLILIDEAMRAAARERSGDE